ncbi:PIN domain-containing protein [Kitasatospora sp. NBC_01287]|uniref:PIN domain-containing protein n=1 Tax=Kitasatospora sp. NBC_01287 TaxID=2903573 RepID=UPI0022532232|nr:PIN domain-containing protein [Kitasatospora sp. NBC_01287]MCX4748639.1 PIN domain-containing protein [Kitasatospora sp. NBC_01287]
MIRYLIDSSALWRLQRDPRLRAAWAGVVSEGVVGSCHPQRTEFRVSARSGREYEVMSRMFDDLYPDVPVPKAAWRWVEAAQHDLAQRGEHQALGVVDLLICATAAHAGLVVLHDDQDFATAARALPDLAERNLNRLPGT